MILQGNWKKNENDSVGKKKKTTNVVSIANTDLALEKEKDHFHALETRKGPAHVRRKDLDLMRKKSHVQDLVKRKGHGQDPRK